MTKKVTVGCDPELFLVTPTGKYISAIGRVGGSKYVPLPIGQGCAIQEDNVAVEFNITPAESAEAFVERCTFVLEELTNRMVPHGLLLSLTASKVFDPDQLRHPKAKVFGCEPDFNAWTKQENDRPYSKNPHLRTTGGHIHIGGVEELDKVQLIRWCDVLLGCSSILEDTLEGSKERRELYGKAGSFRPKPYGVEYRTLSPYWLANKESMSTVFNRTLDVVEKVESGWVIEDTEGADIQAAINNGDKELAERVLRMYGA